MADSIVFHDVASTVCRAVFRYEQLKFDIPLREHTVDRLFDEPFVVVGQEYDRDVHEFLDFCLMLSSGLKARYDFGRILDGRTDEKCTDYGDWTTAWTEIKG